MFSGENNVTMRLAVVTVVVLAGLGVLFFIMPKNQPAPKDAAKEQQRLLAGLRSGKPEVRAKAALQLGKQRPLARETVAGLALALGDPDVGVQASAASALAEIGPLLTDRPEWAEVAVGPAIVGLDDSAKIALPLQEFLGHLGAAGKPAVPALHRYVNFKGLKQRLGAILALLKLDPEHAEELLPGLLGLLGESDPQMRGEALTVLGKIGEKGKGATPKVIALIDGDPDPGIRIEAARTLVSISPADRGRAVSGLVAVIKDIDEQTSGKLKPPAPGPGGRVALDPAAMAHPLHQPRAVALALLLRLDPKAAEAMNP
jgi:HEAT repeat protein